MHTLLSVRFQILSVTPLIDLIIRLWDIHCPLLLPWVENPAEDDWKLFWNPGWNWVENCLGKPVMSKLANEANGANGTGEGPKCPWKLWGGTGSAQGNSSNWRCMSPKIELNRVNGSVNPFDCHLLEDEPDGPAEKGSLKNESSKNGFLNPLCAWEWDWWCRWRRLGSSRGSGGHCPYRSYAYI